ncbi:SET domain-containing protein 5 [Hypsizygus marmoreus]|uniref:SET domain-containing protein 5 n=1 Tax=Hypsizygus marmoreus TaxID=39966 RepID=A0A369JBL5_HYPMA|nr:SET domain-containing protein 5 [Hypsizygus marmoreus]
MSTRRRGKPIEEQVKGGLSKVPKVKRRGNPYFNRRTALPIILGLVLIVAVCRKLYQRIFQTPIIQDALEPFEPSPPVEIDPDIFQVVDIPGRGKGLIANRDIEPGELVIREKPLFKVPHSISTSPIALIAKLLREADASGRQAFLDLSYVNFPEDVDPEEHPDSVALAIFETNAVAAGDGVGIFPRMARLNHGCSSAFNVVYNWRDKEGVLVVHALKSIKKGEELLTTYFDTKRPRVERRAFLAEHYGFNCMCSVCSLPDAQSVASDKRLTQIKDYYGRFATWGERNITGIEAIDAVRSIWALEDEEGYRSERGRLAADAALVAASHSDSAATREWAKKSVEWYGYELGRDSLQVHEMKGVVASPKRHPAWGSRERLKVGGPGGSK